MVMCHHEIPRGVRSGGRGPKHNQMTYSGFPMYVTQCRHQHGMYLHMYIRTWQCPSRWYPSSAHSLGRQICRTHTGGPPYRIIKCSCETATQIWYTTRPLRPTPGALPEGHSYIMEAAPEIAPLRENRRQLYLSLARTERGRGGW